MFPFVFPYLYFTISQGRRQGQHQTPNEIIMKESVFTLVPNNGKTQGAQILLNNASQLEARYKSKCKDELSFKI
jgi:hypothetical protein